VTDPLHGLGIVDTFVNPAMPTRQNASPELRDAVDNYFHRSDEAFVQHDPTSLIAAMDSAGIEKAVITCNADDPSAGEKFAGDYPDRFLLSATFYPNDGMRTIRRLEELAKGVGLGLARVVPSTLDRPPNDRVFYPLYAKCIELGLPISVHTGIPGPPMPAEVQRPIYLDEVCRFFPEAVIIMTHGADPWWGEAIRLMQKYPNLFMMTSAWAPQYLPSDLIDFMNTRGRSKVMFASDFPVLSFERCVTEARALPLREGVLGHYMRENALRVLWRSSSPEGSDGRG